VSSNPRHVTFVQHFLMLGNAVEAAALTGYSPYYGAELLKKQHIQDLINERMEDDPGVCGREERMRYLSGVVRGVDIFQKDDSPRSRFGFALDLSVEPKDRLKACEMLCKMAGDFKGLGDAETSAPSVVLMLPAVERAEGRRRAGGGRLHERTIEAEFEAAS